MSSPPAASFLDFFVLEASEYVEQIDGLLLRAAEAGPDSEALQRVARALRGSATMAKLSSFADLASSVEAVGRSLRQGTLGWDVGLKGALTAAVDELKILVRAARAWSATEDQSAAKRIAELSRYAQTASPTAMSAAASSPTFFANETNNIAAGLELLATRPDDREGAANVLHRVRALRGVAGMKEVPALADVSEAAESAMRPLEKGELRLSPERVNVLQAAAELLRAISEGLKTGQSIGPSAPQYLTFAGTVEALRAYEEEGDRIIAIADLFYSDAGPHVVQTSPSPPTSPEQRFRMELVGLGEHLQRLIGDVRAASDEMYREQARAALRRALRDIRALASSFGQHAVATTVETLFARTDDLDAGALDAVAGFATTISPAATAPTPIVQRAVPPVPAAPPVQRPIGAAPAPTHARVFSAVPAAPARAASTLDSTIAAFESLAAERMAEPVAVDDEVMPVDALLYRGRAALDRAIELRDAIRGGATPASPEVLEELYDLVELARVD